MLAAVHFLVMMTKAVKSRTKSYDTHTRLRVEASEICHKLTASIVIWACLISLMINLPRFSLLLLLLSNPQEALRFSYITKDKRHKRHTQIVDMIKKGDTCSNMFNHKSLYVHPLCAVSYAYSICVISIFVSI